MKLRAAILSLLLSAWAAPAFSQGCAMCFSTAAAASKDGQKAIGRGVLVLILPPTVFMSLGVGLALHYAKKRDLENG
jgi:ABC-type Fe3+ transport system permease subunit